MKYPTATPILGLLAVVAGMTAWTFVQTSMHNVQLAAFTERHNAQLAEQADRHNAQLAALAQRHEAELARRAAAARGE